MKKDAASQKKFHMVLVGLTLAFTIFLILKLSGLFDFTGRYGITHITSSVSDGEGALMLDGDPLTYWNTYDRTMEAGDAICIYFGEEKEISGVCLDMDAESDPDLTAGEGTLQFACRRDGAWEPVTAAKGEDGSYLFENPVTADGIRIAVRADLTEEEAKALSWRIKELAIDEK